MPLSEWNEYAYWDSERYTRNLLAAQQRFSLILLCWEPGQHTPVHTHQVGSGASSTCSSYGYVLKGELLLTQYSDEDECSGSIANA